jgi:selenide, water dikinase
MSEAEPIRLTQYAKRAGCAAKQPQEFLLALLGKLPPIDDPNVLVGHATSDDAAIYRLSDDLALILTTDFFTPIVDDPYDFGAVAAANALSDVYAMAGTPLAALSLVGFPAGTLEPSVLGDILRGAAETAKEAGIAIVGGHTIQSEEPIFGLAVVGRVDPRRMITNAGARPGDLLILTKPLGLGVITTAAKRGEDSLNAIVEAVKVMKTLNRDAARILSESGSHALTDVTGYGLMGHLRNILTASGVGAQVWADRVPIIKAARTYVEKGIAPGGTHHNRKFISQWVSYDDSVTETEQLLLCDAQTSGGLLAAVPAGTAEAAVQKLHSAGLSFASIIGSIEPNNPGRIQLVSNAPPQ